MKNKIKNIKQKVENHPKVKGLLDWSKEYPLPGSGGVAIYDIGKFIYEETKKDNLTTRANSVAFSFFLAIFPFIIFLFTLLPYLPITDTYFQLVSDATKKFLPANAHEYIMNMIGDIAKIKREGLLSLGFVLALYFSSSGILTLMNGFDKSYETTFKQRNIFTKQGIALMLTMMMSVLFILSLGLAIVGRKFIPYLDSHFTGPFKTWVYQLVTWLTAFLLLNVGINTLYTFGPSLKKKLPFINPGSIVASVLSLLSSIFFAYFVNNFGKYNELYGSIGALIVILMWLKINAFILLVGFELNASIAVNRDLLKIIPKK